MIVLQINSHLFICWFIDDLLIAFVQDAYADWLSVGL